MKGYNGKKDTVMIERRKCQDQGCRKLHRCLPSQLTKFKHFLTEIIEDTVDDVVVPEDPEDPTLDGTLVESPSPRTVARWKKWIDHNKSFINGYLKAVGHGLLDFGPQFLKSGISLLDELRKYGGGWIATIQQLIYNTGESLRSYY